MNQNSATTMNNNFGIIRYNNNPGTVPGYVVYSETEQREVTDYSNITGYEWIEEDIGSWQGPRRTQQPIYGTKIVRYTTWIAIPEANVNAWEAQYN